MRFLAILWYSLSFLSSALIVRNNPSDWMALQILRYSSLGIRVLTTLLSLYAYNRATRIWNSSDDWMKWLTLSRVSLLRHHLGFDSLLATDLKWNTFEWTLSYLYLLGGTKIQFLITFGYIYVWDLFDWSAVIKVTKAGSIIHARLVRYINCVDYEGADDNILLYKTSVPTSYWYIYYW